MDFLIIGAQKSGTTSLFKYLTAHPSIFMPPEKEVMFFNNDNLFSKGKDWYINRYFQNADPSHVNGEASTHYMMYSFVPERIYSFFPNVKLIALLRNPIDRAYSHYLMAVRRGVESRTFEECVNIEITKGFISDEEIDHNTDYIFFGEYGRILSNYLNWFENYQIKIAFMEEMQNDSTSFIKDIYSFLGVDSNFIPENVSKKYNTSGVAIIPGLEIRIRKFLTSLKRNKIFHIFLKKVNIDAIVFWLRTEGNVRKQKDEYQLTPKVRKLLADYYMNDVRLLESLFETRAPWKDFN
ncbi:sulfotransferase family protein [Methylotuvimicrobium sp. KM1]|uniref:sulfotransferase family protein n=1 Tax=Methylotuvimicrobium sp. KM1 TaxID=3377707 RepID=UPI00384E4F35